MVRRGGETVDDFAAGPPTSCAESAANAVGVRCTKTRSRAVEEDGAGSQHAPSAEPAVDQIPSVAQEGPAADFARTANVTCASVPRRAPINSTERWQAHSPRRDRLKSRCGKPLAAVTILTSPERQRTHQ